MCARVNGLRQYSIGNTSGGTLWLKPNPQEGGRQRFEVKVNSCCSSTHVYVSLYCVQLVNVTTIDSFVAKTIGQPLHFLKVDAEGKDRDVLEGAAEQIRSHLSLFSFECAPCALKEQELRRLDDLGYSCYSLTRAGKLCENIACIPNILSLIRCNSFQDCLNGLVIARPTVSGKSERSRWGMCCAPLAIAPRCWHCPWTCCRFRVCSELRTLLLPIRVIIIPLGVSVKKG